MIKKTRKEIPTDTHIQRERERELGIFSIRFDSATSGFLALLVIRHRKKLKLKN